MSFLVDAIGTAGALMFAASCAPLAWKTWKKGAGLGTPLGTVWSFTIATWLFTTYLALKVGFVQGPTLISAFETLCWLIVLWFEYFPRNEMLKKHLWAPYQNEYQGEHVGQCTRERNHQGPCNGFPAWTCNIPYDIDTKPNPLMCDLPWDETDSVKLVYTAHEIFKKTSD